MKEVVNSSQMKAIDSYTIEKIGIPALVLMERAALQVGECVKQHCSKQDRILAVCGIGNNGGDGVAAARILYMEGYQADILLVGDETKASEQTKQQLLIARNLGVSIYNNIKIDEYTIIIDAILGIGLSREVTGIYEEIIKEINTGKNLIVSVDIPSGLSTDTAKPLGVAVKADYTVTFGFNKIGLILYPGLEYAGKVMVADIGFPSHIIEDSKLYYYIYDKTDLEKLPKRKEYSNKGTYGKVLIIAGSANMSGACFFSAKAAYRTGAGLVKVMTASENRTAIQTMLPEAILSTYESGKPIEDTLIKFAADISWANVIVIGPGIGVNDYTEKLLKFLVEHTKVPLIIDADGINLLSKMKNSNFEEIAAYLPEQTILTPHLMELSRLTGISTKDIADDLLGIADKCTNKNKLIFAIKDAKTIVAYKKERYMNTSGNNGMATGGMGDALTGIIAALIAQGLTPKEATVLGVFIHGLAGDAAALEKGHYALMASDVIESLADVLK